MQADELIPHSKLSKINSSELAFKQNQEL
jgi:hypothetical protein